MVEVVDLTAVRPHGPGDPAGLRAYLQQLVGEPFLFAARSYGDELRLHFGEARERKSARRPGQVRGSYILGLRASGWVVKPAAGTRVVFSSDAEPAADAAPVLGLVPGTKVTAADPTRSAGGYGLALTFADGSSLVASPSAEPDPTEIECLPVADWELLTPHDRVLTAGPGSAWGYDSSTG